MLAAAGLASWRVKAVTFDNADEPSEDAINGEIFNNLNDSGLQTPTPENQFPDSQRPADYRDPTKLAVWITMMA